MNDGNDVDINKEQRNTKIGLGCLLLFLSPFLIVGGWALISGLTDLSKRGDLSEDTIGKLGVGGMFTFVAGALLTMSLIGYRKASQETKFKEQFPNEPWKWQRDWLEGRIDSNSGAAALVIWFFGLVFGAAGVLILFKIGEITEESPLGYIALLFPLVGFGMLGTAVYLTLQWAKYRDVHCDLVSKPGVVGGWFQAIVWANINFGPGDKVDAQLTCYYRRAGKGKNDNTTRKVQWQEDIVIDQDRMMVERDGTYAIPIKVWIPRDCSATTPGSPPDRYEWDLTAKAEVSGIDFSATFTVPVFETEESQDEAPPNFQELAVGTEPQPYHPTILITEGIGSLKLNAPPRRNIGALLSITFFWVIWTAICIGLFYSDAPILFPIVFSVFDLLITYAAVWMWFGSVSVHFDHDTVSIDKTILGYGRRTYLDVSEISEIDMHVNMQSGNTPYYVIRLHTGGKHTSTLDGLKNKDEAEHLIAKMKEYLSSQAK